MKDGYRSYRNRYYRHHVNLLRARYYATERIEIDDCDERIAWRYRPEDRATLIWRWEDFPRARRTRGWKNRRCRYQWEHRVIEAEKHTRNRMTRAKRDGGVLFPDE